MNEKQQNLIYLHLKIAYWSTDICGLFEVRCLKPTQDQVVFYLNKINWHRLQKGANQYTIEQLQKSFTYNR